MREWPKAGPSQAAICVTSLWASSLVSVVFSPGQIASSRSVCDQRRRISTHYQADEARSICLSGKEAGAVRVRRGWPRGIKAVIRDPPTRPPWSEQTLSAGTRRLERLEGRIYL